MKILFVGFSVTEEKDGYVDVLKKMIEGSDSPVHINSKAIGGITFDTIPFFLNSFIKEDYDFVIYEIATCYRFLDSMSDYESILNEICELTIKTGATPCFVNMYRHCIDYNSDLLSTSIEYVSKLNRYPFLNLINEVTCDNENYLLRDGIHTTQAGANFYAKRLFDFINSLPVGNKSKLTGKQIIFASDIIENKSIGYFERGGYKSSIIKILESETCVFSFSHEVTICGIVFVRGPNSGAIKLDFPEAGFTRNIHMFDEYCYYRRYAVQMLPENTVTKITLTQSALKPSVQLKKGSYNEESRYGEIVGFFVK